MSESPDARALRKKAWARQALAQSGAKVEGWAVGSCLSPLVSPGQRVRLVRRDPRVGEVVAYRVGDTMRAHRVVAVGEGVVTVRPDRPGLRLERVPVADLMGVWAAESIWSAPFLTRGAGRLVMPWLLRLSHPTAVRVLRAAARLPRGVGRIEVSVGTGEATDLSRDLSRAGLLPPGRSLEEFASHLLGSEGFCVIARRGRRPVGAVQGTRTAGGLLIAITIKARYRGRGVGGMLLDAFIGEARARGIPRLVAEIRRTNSASRALFRRRGFSMTDLDVGRQSGTGDALDRFVFELG